VWNKQLTTIYIQEYVVHVCICVHVLLVKRRKKSIVRTDRYLDAYWMNINEMDCKISIYLKKITWQIREGFSRCHSSRLLNVPEMRHWPGTSATSSSSIIYWFHQTSTSIKHYKYLPRSDEISIWGRRRKQWMLRTNDASPVFYYYYCIYLFWKPKYNIYQKRVPKYLTKKNKYSKLLTYRDSMKSVCGRGWDVSKLCDR
jgi:hypothetical protein